MIERTYIIPLRKEFQKVPTYKKSKKAAKTVKEFVSRHMKTEIERVKVLNEVNNYVWKHGIRNPPPRVNVVCRKDEKGTVLVQLFGKSFPEEKVEESKGIVQKVAEAVTGKKEETKTIEKPTGEKSVVEKSEAEEEKKEGAAQQQKAEEVQKPAKKKAVKLPAAPKAPAQPKEQTQRANAPMHKTSEQMR